MPGEATDRLEIQISDNAEVAEKGIDKLAAALGRLKDATTNNAGLNKVAKALDGLQKAVNGTAFEKLDKAMAPITANAEKISAGLGAAQWQLKNFTAASNTSAASATKASGSYSKMGASLASLNAKANLTALYFGLRRVATILSGFVHTSNQYIEDMNLFTVSMGEYAAAAYDYAQKAQELAGIDAGEFMRNQGFFNQMITGMGGAGDAAALMSKNLTQLVYDMASYYNMDYATMAQKLQSGIAGEIEPLRRLGFALTEASLQEVALANGIDESVRSMTEAEKVQLRYIAIMEQSVNAQHDMARTLTTPANAMRIFSQQVTLLSRSLGNLLIPMLTAVMPYVIAFVKVLRMAAEAIASLFGVTLPTINYDAFEGMSVGAGAAEDMEDSLGGAAKAAKKMKDYVLGIDELNIFRPQEESAGGGSGGGGIGGGGFDGLDLPQYDFLEGLSKQADDLVGKMKGVLSTIASIGAELLAWRVAKGVVDALRFIEGLKFPGLLSFGIAITGIGLFLDSWNTMKEAIDDIIANGTNFTNVTKLISGFAEGMGAAFLLFGNIKFAGASLIISGLSGIVSDISDMVNNGINFENATSFVKNVGLFVGGIGLAFGNLKLGGIGLIISGVSLIVENFHAFVTGFTTGDWSGVEWVEVASGALLLVGGLILALKKISSVSDIASIGAAGETLKTVSTATESVSTNMGGLSSKLSGLAKNLGMGLIIIAEVAAAALLITGAIALMGKLLEQVGVAWEPVIANGGTIAIAMGLGVAVLGVVGVATALLGSVGTPLIVNIALGTAILAELGIATGLFLVEIWAIGKGLDEIGKAWEPVLANGDTIATGIALGTALLVGIGVVTALLGVATVASAGLLPLAIGLGTAILVELAVAFIAFTESLVAVANELSDRLSPALVRLNPKLPPLSENLSDFVDFMEKMAGHIVRYSASNIVAGLAGTIDTIVGWFVKDPLEKMADSVQNTYDGVVLVNKKLRVAVPEMKKAKDLLGSYVTILRELENITGKSSAVTLSADIAANMNDFGQSLVTGFEAGVSSRASLFVSVGKQFTEWWNTVKSWWRLGTISGVTQDAGQAIGQGLISGINAKSPMIISTAQTLSVSVLQKFREYLNTQKSSAYGTDIINGIVTGINTKKPMVIDAARALSASVLQVFQDYLNTYKSYTYGADTVSGIAAGIRGYAWAASNAMLDVGTALSGALAQIISNLQTQAAANPINIQMTTTHTVNTIANTIAGTAPRTTPVRGYASGGIVNSGQLFMARENGTPEMVGKFGSQTGVVNNEQILEAMRQAVYEATYSAIADNSDIFGANVNVSIGDEDIYNANERGRRAHGYQIAPVGV